MQVEPIITPKTTLRTAAAALLGIAAALFYPSYGPITLPAALLALVMIHFGAGTLTEPPTPQKRLTFSLADFLPLATCIATALASQFLVLRPEGPIAILQNGDAGLVASFVAGWLHPARFTNDELLNNTNNFIFYISVVLPYVACLNLFTKDIGTAYLWLYFPLILSQLCGFYLLGRWIFHNRYWAFVLAFITFPPIWIWGANELWGSYYVPLTRTTFEAILPFLLLGFLQSGPDPKKIPWLFGVCGLTVYAHPVDAPAVTAGLTFASFSFADRETFYRYLRNVLVGSAVFILIATPFAVIFFRGFPGIRSLGSIAPASSQADATKVFHAMVGPLYYNAMLAAKLFYEETLRVHPFIWGTGLASFFCVPILNPNRKRMCIFFILFMSGLIIASVGLCFVDQQINALFKRGPIQIDLIRGVRFILPSLLIGFVLLLSELQALIIRSRLANRWTLMLSLFAMLMLLWWLHTWPTRLSGAIGLSNRIPPAFTKYDRNAELVLRTLRAQPNATPVLPLTNGEFAQAVRYAALQPVVYATKDANALFYSESPQRFHWLKVHNLLSSLKNASDPRAAAAQLSAVIRATSPDLLVLQRNYVSAPVRAAADSMGTVILQRGKWMLIKLTPK